MKIYSEKYSFVQFYTQKGVLPYASSLLNKVLNNDWLERQIPGFEMGYYLPVSAHDDLYFGVYVECTLSEALILCNLDTKTKCRIYFMPGIRDNAPTLAEITAQSPKSWPDASNGGYQYVQKVRISDNLFFFYWKWPLFDIMQYALNKCFQLALRIDASVLGSPNDNILISNGMVGIGHAEGYTTTLEYRSEIGDYGFMYHSAVDFSHKVRIGMYPDKVEYPEDEKVYVKSNGDRKFTKSNTYKRYTWNVDYLPEWGHEMLLAALKHDTTTVNSTVIQGQIRKDGPYTIDPIEKVNYPMAPASFKAYVVPFQMNKDVCAINPNTYVPHNYDSLVDYVACGTQSFNLAGIVPSTCDGEQYFELIYANPAYTTSAVVNNATKTLDVVMKNVTADITIAIIRVIHPRSKDDTITIKGFFATSECI